MSKDNSALYKFFSFVVLVIAAFLILVKSILPLISINIEGLPFKILDIIKNLALLIGIAIGGYGFVKSKSSAWRIIYWVAIGLYIVGTFLVLKA